MTSNHAIVAIGRLGFLTGAVCGIALTATAHSWHGIAMGCTITLASLFGALLRNP